MDNPAAPIPPIPAQPAVSSLPVEALSKAGPAESSNRRWLLWLAGGLFMLIIGIAIGVFSAKFFSQSQSQSQLTSTPSPTLSPTPTPALDPTANWKTYTDTKSGFSLKYPSDYFIYQGDPNLGFVLTTSAPKEGVSQIFLGENDARLGASAEDSTILNDTLDQYLSRQQAVFKNIQKIISKKSVMIGGISGYKVTFTFQVTQEGNSGTTMYISEGLVIKNGKRYSVSLSSFNQKLLDSKQTMFDQILSTFKFLDRGE